MTIFNKILKNIESAIARKKAKVVSANGDFTILGIMFQYVE